MLELTNPHSILAALESRPHDVQKIAITTGDRGGAWDAVRSLAQKSGKTVSLPGAGSSGRSHGSHSKGPDLGGRTSGSHAILLPKHPVSVKALFQNEGPEDRGLWLALDSIQDPHNVGAIFRVAGFFGVRGILVTSDRSASLTSTVYDVASGGMEAVPFSIETNLRQAIDQAKDAGLWTLGSSERASQDLKSIERDRPWLLILGNEERGMRRLTEDSCDVVCKISGAGKVDSLNVGSAASILIHTLSS